MSKRLQVLFDESEYSALQAAAHNQHMTVAEWVRQALRTARQTQPLETERSKLAAVKQAVAHEFPSGDIEQMLAETERGYATGLDP